MWIFHYQPCESSFHDCYNFSTEHWLCAFMELLYNITQKLLSRSCPGTIFLHSNNTLSLLLVAIPDVWHFRSFLSFLLKTAPLKIRMAKNGRKIFLPNVVKVLITLKGQKWSYWQKDSSSLYVYIEVSAIF